MTEPWSRKVWSVFSWNRELDCGILPASFSQLMKMSPAARNRFMLGRVEPVISEAQKHFFICHVQTDCWPSSRRQAQTKISVGPSGQHFSTDEIRSKRKCKAIGGEGKKKKSPNCSIKLEGQYETSHLLCVP